MSTAHQLYQCRPLGFPDFGAWMRHHERAHAEMRKVLPDDHPLAQAMGPEWLELWLGVQELLGMPARAERKYGRAWYPVAGERITRTVAFCIDFGCHTTRSYPTRVVLLDGTIIKEWP